MVHVDDQLLGEPEQLIYDRHNDLDVSFIGWVIGIGDHGKGPVHAWKPEVHLKGVRVEIALTAGGTLVGWVKRYSPEGDKCDACVAELPEELLRWLRADSGGKLGPATKKAWAQACEYGPLKAYAFQEVS